MKLFKIAKEYDKELSVFIHNGERIVAATCLKKLLKRKDLKHMDFNYSINEEGNTLTLMPRTFIRGQFKKNRDFNKYNQ